MKNAKCELATMHHRISSSCNFVSAAVPLFYATGAEQSASNQWAAIRHFLPVAAFAGGFQVQQMELCVKPVRPGIATQSAAARDHAMARHNQRRSVRRHDAADG